MLVVIRSPRVRLIRGLRRALRAAGPRVRRGVTIFTNAEVVCVDGLDRVEAVIVRRIGTGRLIGINASAIHMVGGANEGVERKNRESESSSFISRTP